MQTRSHWNDYAGQWHLLDTPLRPHPQDVAAVLRAVSLERPVLLLGVTPELSRLPMHGIAIDKSQEMLRCVWQQHPGWKAVLGDWLQLPIDAQAIQQVIGDGVFNVLKFPEDYASLLRELIRVAGPAGRIVFRQFVSPSQMESLEAIRHDAMSNRIGNFHVLKWRLAMSIAATAPDWNVPVQDILNTFNCLFDNRDALVQATGWNPSVFATVDIYVGSTSTLSFPPWEVVKPRLRSVATGIDIQTGDYELSERCPTITLTGLHCDAN